MVMKLRFSVGLLQPHMQLPLTAIGGAKENKVGFFKTQRIKLCQDYTARNLPIHSKSLIVSDCDKVDENQTVCPVSS